MTPQRPGLARFARVLALVALACDGSGAPESDSDAGARWEPAPEAAPRDAVVDAGSPPDAPATRPPPTGGPLPAGVLPARRLLPPGAKLTGGGDGSCTHQFPAAGDRWCVFTRAGAGTQSELWVINVTGAAAAVPPCDGSHPGCLRLSTDVFTGGAVNGPFQPYANRFFGDTLIYYADTRSGPLEVHRGPAFAWRPGWMAPRRISTDEALECWAHPRALFAHCVEALAGDPAQPDSFELRAGVIGDRDGLSLPSLGRIVPRNAEGQLVWQAGFSPDGEHFAVSFVPAPAGPAPPRESLHVIPTTQLGLAPLVAGLNDLRRWQISNDGKRIYFLRPTGPDAHGVFVADFPSGANVVELAARVSDYFVLGSAGIDRGVGFLSERGPDRGAFHLAGDPTTAGATTVFSYEAGLDGLRLSDDLRFTAWRDPDFRVKVVEHQGLRSCGLNVMTRQPAYAISFLAHAGLVFWTEGNGGDRDRRDGYVGDPVGCQDRRRFAQSIYFVVPVGDRGVIFADEVDDDTQRTTLKYAAISEGKRWPAEGPVRVHENIDGTSVLVVGKDKDPVLLLFTVSGGAAEQQGTFLFGPVPF